MGFTFRKSIKIGKNTRINLSSKGGVGISTGVKGARVSVNKKGGKLYGGKGPIRFQKQIFSNNNKSSAIETSNQKQEYIDENVPTIKKKRIKLNFFRRNYKEIIVVIIGICIGTSIGGKGRVSTTLVTEVETQIKENTKTIESKQAELDRLNDKLNELNAIVNK